MIGIPPAVSIREANSELWKKSDRTVGRRNAKLGEKKRDLKLVPFLTNSNHVLHNSSLERDTFGRNRCTCTKKGCNWTFPSVEELKSHMKVIHKASPYVCRHCNKLFGSRAGLWYHEAEHKGKFRFWCDNCKKGFNRKEQFTTHLNTKHDGGL